MNAWDHLPNAAAIDEVLESLKKHPKAWGAARDATRDAAWSAAWGAARAAAWDAIWGAARAAAWDAARGAVRDAARGAVLGAVRDAVLGAVRDTALDASWAAWDAIAALIAYDDMGELIKQPLPHLQGLYCLDPHPAFLLFQPASLVFNQPEFKT